MKSGITTKNISLKFFFSIRLRNYAIIDKFAVISESVASRKFLCNVNIPRDPRGYSLSFSPTDRTQGRQSIRRWSAGNCMDQVPDGTNCQLSPTTACLQHNSIVMHEWEYSLLCRGLLFFDCFCFLSFRSI